MNARLISWTDLVPWLAICYLGFGAMSLIFFLGKEFYDPLAWHCLIRGEKTRVIYNAQNSNLSPLFGSPAHEICHVTCENYNGI